jgi:hypothetical protein
MPRLSDTTPEAERVLAEAYRRMPAERKWHLMSDLVRQGRVFHEAGLRQRRPDLTPVEIRDDWVAVHYGTIPPHPDRGKADTMRPVDVMQVVRDVVTACEANEISYALGGSMASSYHGIARFTADADLAVEPFPGREEAFGCSFDQDYYVNVDAIRRANRDRSSFNLIHTAMGFKADIFVMKPRPFEISLMARKRPAPIDGDRPWVEVVSPEDVILLKLEWFRLGGEMSDRQWGDILGVLRVQAGQLDADYLDHWAAELGVLDLLGKARDEATL